MRKLLNKMADDNDEDVCDSWEDMLDNNVLEQKLKKITPHSIADDEKIEFSSGQSMYMGPMILQEDTGRTPYTPPEPQVKILKRPTNSTYPETMGATAISTTIATKNIALVNPIQSNALMNGERIAKQPVKSLQQREAEYAEARLRILGSAKSEEEMAEERASKYQKRTNNACSQENLSINRSNIQSHIKHFEKYRNDNTRLAKLGLNSHPEIAIRGLQLTSHYDHASNNVIRQPRGPDGSAGFCMKR